jgi:hypothetical protein
MASRTGSEQRPEPTSKTLIGNTERRQWAAADAPAQLISRIPHCIANLPALEQRDQLVPARGREVFRHNGKSHPPRPYRLSDTLGARDHGASPRREPQ